jgi:hypothetical protein
MYLDEARWDVPTEHTPWAESQWAHLQDDPEFQEWAARAEEYGDKVGQDTVASFRASWKFDGKWQWDKK